MVKLDDHGRVLQIFDKPRQTTLEMMWGAMIWRPHFTEHLHDCVQRKVTMPLPRNCDGGRGLSRRPPTVRRSTATRSGR